MENVWTDILGINGILDSVHYLVFKRMLQNIFLILDLIAFSGEGSG
jgi:hypothetical protein